ncbi:uncharacterized protein [Oryza sativa Japonica Group]|uniref:Expressed protein n=2 Tax=Oryza sativa subsp. japonica TaxID=39947 RepID=Q2QLM2_ORYSJ|nr:uncharacterized protein LOC9267278 [Oryza sativa Japonica Group]ABA99976.1 expressed protein [Oryza sativa Japonica Group]EAZ21341.1 hypothetical protein OsJ_36998 [Oryza sativa Japonica Group]KAF2909016.1 hypothetical protein DAI22_12g224900 [Oryza sativa Japonica Group]BAG99138.1 unnamed protein product [Oryza sativa Japonica Group]BAH95806.1 Os12g0636600 [Oryza sativa Japonica Group]|eukprot:NP_001177078.1 Os12g0636600 [Oryza sativa Japonica Group]
MADGDRQEAEAPVAGIKRVKEEEATASPSGGEKKKILPNWRKSSIPCEGSEILKKKKEAIAARPLWVSRDVPGAMECWIEEREKALAEEEADIASGKKKRKKVVKYKMPNEVIQQMMRYPYTYPECTEEELARRSASNRQLHRLRMFIDGKMFAYEQTLIDQYLKHGYAFDEAEISDEEEEEEEEQK